jgi:hypothetical protein
MTEPFGALNTVKAAYIVYKDILHGFLFASENSSLNVADQVLASMRWHRSALCIQRRYGRVYKCRRARLRGSRKRKRERTQAQA